ncbi:hypothetical protein B0H11DRAFT_1957887, partial [Mycena galericulata]
ALLRSIPICILKIASFQLAVSWLLPRECNRLAPTSTRDISKLYSSFFTGCGVCKTPYFYLSRFVLSHICRPSVVDVPWELLRHDEGAATMVTHASTHPRVADIFCHLATFPGSPYIPSSLPLGRVSELVL